jgi:hypothetical protein
MTNTIRYSLAKTPSTALWQGQGPYIGQVFQDPGYGFGFCDHFLSEVELSHYTLTQATAGTFALDDAVGGVALLDCNSTTQGQGGQIQRQGASTGAVFLPSAGTTIWFEARIKVADTATGPEFFLGLSAEDDTLIATQANSSPNHIGFESVTNNLVLLFHGEKAGTRASCTTPGTLVDDTWVKLGFRVNGVTSVDVFVDGVKFLGTNAITSASIPVVALTPSVVCQAGGTTDPITHIDWLACAQTSA